MKDFQFRDSDSVEADTRSSIPHAIATVIAVLVFPLIWIGALVTTYDAGMAVPDWPGTYGYNMFLYPLETWLFGPFDLLVEHGHRLLASIAGLVTIGLVICTFRFEPRWSIRLFAMGLLVLIIVQGLLGGFRVLFDARTIAKVHGCVGPAFFGCVVAFCVVTSAWWHRNRVASQGDRSPGPFSHLTRFAALMLGLSYVQLCIGAFIRHVGLDVSPRYFSHLVLMHIGMGVALVVGTAFHWVRSNRQALKSSGVLGSIHVLMLLIVVQFSLGLATWVMKYGWPVWFENQAWAAASVIVQKSLTQGNIVTAHSATGSLILAFWTIHLMRCWRLFGFNGRPIAAGRPVENEISVAQTI